MSTTEGTVILEIGEWDRSRYVVEREHHGYWESAGYYVSREAAFARAEQVHRDAGDGVRVIDLGAPEEAGA